jgi:hypothetical protein
VTLPLAVFVPLAGTLPNIKRGSGIVGSDAPPQHGYQMTEIDFEGNLYGADNIRTYADRVMHAADRHETKYPTVARMTVPDDTLVYVGDFDGKRVNFDPVNFLALAEWLDAEGSLFDPRELLVSS